jgi:protein-S-isoprenylcysteine O-methyltransferase Ste14
LRRVVTLLLHLSLAILVLLVGWGFAKVQTFWEEPARCALLIGMFCGACAVFLLRIDLDPLRKGESLHAGQDWLLLGLAIASILLLLWLPHADRAGIWVLHASFVRWLGLALCLAGGMIRVVALHCLGPQFSAYVTIQSNHRLVEDGIYARIRHPLYLSLLLAGPGLALVFRSQLAWPIAAAAVTFVMNRIELEESLLASHFGTRFSVYRARTWALLPLIY